VRIALESLATEISKRDLAELGTLLDQMRFAPISTMTPRSSTGGSTRGVDEYLDATQAGHEKIVAALRQ
jgi:hypothetical protein